MTIVPAAVRPDPVRPAEAPVVGLGRPLKLQSRAARARHQRKRGSEAPPASPVERGARAPAMGALKRRHDISTGCMGISAVKGFRDALPEAALLGRVEVDRARRPRARYGSPAADRREDRSSLRARDRRDHRHRREDVHLPRPRRHAADAPSGGYGLAALRAFVEHHLDQKDPVGRRSRRDRCSATSVRRRDATGSSTRSAPS